VIAQARHIMTLAGSSSPGFEAPELPGAPVNALAGGVPRKEDRTWAMVAHLSAFAGHVFPFAHIIAPLVVWLVKKDSSEFVDIEGKESVNAQISVTIYVCLAIPFCLLLLAVPLLAGFVTAPVSLVLLLPALPFCVFAGIPLMLGIYVANFILVIVAAMAANDGRPYRYPFILRLVR
jgi:uncharacterized Tic20 family protein